MYQSTPTLRLKVAEREVSALDLRQAFGRDLLRLPWTMRILAENVLRTGPRQQIPATLQLFRDWLGNGRSDAEVEFRPGRVLMHDTTCGPALVDIAAMRDALFEAGGDPAILRPDIQVDVSVDHSLAVQQAGSGTARRFNEDREMLLNSERYRLMKWASATMGSVTVFPPGTGIMHTINLEQLASVIGTASSSDGEWVVPDTMIGTDSHTPMINSIGVLGWGVGGLEAESVMFGLPVMMALPEVVGVRLHGSLREGVMSTDLALVITQRLRDLDVSGKFVEFFGPGLEGLSAGDRGVIANMAPEYGATTGFFPVDDATITYLIQTGRSSEQVALVESATKAMGLWFDPSQHPIYSAELEIDLSKVSPSLAGPHRPQDRIDVADTKRFLPPPVIQTGSRIPQGAVAIAAITSCTNTTDPRLLVAAGLLSRRARALGIHPPSWVKTSLAPGSPAAAQYLKSAGLDRDLEALGFHIVGFGCSTCIGNSGPLHQEMSEAIKMGVSASAVLSGNRNFPGRVHPELTSAFLASPPMVVAFALAGDTNRDILLDPIGNAGGRDIFLKDVWPTATEIDRVLRTAVKASQFRDAFAEARASVAWSALPAPTSQRFPWDDTSTYLRRPPFVSSTARSRMGRFVARPLLVLGDDVTTDHISPAGQISPQSAAGRFLLERGIGPSDFNVYASRRGNWEIMLRGLFDNQSVVNHLNPACPPGYGDHTPSGDRLTLPDLAERYAREGVSLVMVAGERYGTGSSRDWAAKGVGLLGVRAVLAKSFERIHRSNLVGMGVVPIEIPEQIKTGGLCLQAGETIELDISTPKVRGAVEAIVHRNDGSTSTFQLRLAVYTELELETLFAGGMIPLILQKALRASH